MIMNSYATFHDLSLNYEFRFEFMYMKNVVKSYMKSGVPRLQMSSPSGPTGSPYQSSSAAQPGLLLPCLHSSRQPWRAAGLFG